MLRFNPEKVAEAACFFAEKEGKEINYMKLIKLLYIADRKALDQWGTPISKDTYVSMKNGPVLSNTLNMIKNKYSTHIWQKHFSEPSSKYTITMIDKLEPGELSRRELNLLKDVYDEYGSLSEFQLVEYCHSNFKEWEEPTDGSKVNNLPLERVLTEIGKTKEEIEDITDELDHEWNVSQAFAR